MTLQLFTSNRLEILSEALAEVLRTPLSSTLDEEVIIVMSKGMESWVSMQLARYYGICANCRFPFPNRFIREVFQKIVSDHPELSPFDPKIMTWRIMGLLPSLILKPGFESPRNYLGDHDEELKRLQLSERIADTFDQYLLFRPEMIFQWERGRENHWQAVLWRELVKGYEDQHRAALGKAFFEAVKNPSMEITGLPERVSVFGISSLPLFHLQVLAGISRFTQVNLFLMNPCREYWGDILSEWKMKRAISRERAQDITAQELHMEKGNSLLASMGTLGSDFFNMVYEFDLDESSDFEDPGEGHLLSCIQSDIMNLLDRQPKLNGKKSVAVHDESIQIHSCHSPMREMEVLYDRFLHMFERDSSLKPKDILVMTPDIETYAPYIQAIFDVPTDDSTRIPISIADQSIRKESEIIDTFLSILHLRGSRFGASQVLAILESPTVGRRFGLSQEDMPLVRRWVKDTRIRWGIDAENRRKMELPTFSENTWKAGLERLLLGFAMPGQDENMFGGVLPYDHVEGGETLILGRFLDFTHQLFNHIHSLTQPRTLCEWSQTLNGLLERFFMADEDTEWEMKVIRRVLNDLGEMGEVSLFHEEIDMNVIEWHLGHALEGEGFGYGFMTGGVTFCAMLPMRSIPFKVICLVGMDCYAYPRESKPLGFDLMAKNPKPGDRSRRNDDRHLFLEAMLSAREKLYISYVGQSIQDNSLIPPSVLVSELLDYIEQGFEISGKDILESIVIPHRLQAFSPDYFTTNEKLISYSGENCRAAQCLGGDREAPMLFISKGLSEPEAEWRTVNLDELCNFFGNPARFLLNRRLGIHLEERVSILEERETFEMMGLDRYMLEERMVKRRSEGEDLKDLFYPTQASGQLPHGAVGECTYENLVQGVNRFVEKTQAYKQGRVLEPLEVDLQISGFRVTGHMETLYSDRLMQYRYTRVKSKDRIRLWIYHLALNCIRDDTCPRISMFAGLDSNGKQRAVWTAWEYSPVENSEEILGKLLEQYWAGLRNPLHFFPESSWTYVHMFLERNRDKEDALSMARNTWMGSDYFRGESEDAYYHQCFRNSDPLDLEFQRLAEGVFEPIVRHQIEIY